MVSILYILHRLRLLSIIIDNCGDFLPTETFCT